MKTFEKKTKGAVSPVRRRRAPVLPSFDPAAQSQRAQIRQVLRSPPLQAKLTIGQTGDKYEQEADRVAEQVMRMPEPQEEELIQTKPIADQITPIAQRQVEEEEEEEEPIQTKLLSTEHLILQRQVEEVEEESEATVTLAGPPVVQIVIQRQDETSLSTIGTLTVGSQTFHTLELPNRGNRSTGDWRTAGRIPAGTYSAHVRTGGGRGWRLQLQDVDRRGTAPIQIHQGNVPEHTTGCILAGTGTGENRVNNSRNAMAQIRQIVQNAGPGATIQVTIIDTPVEAEGTEEGVIHPKEFRGQAPEIIPILESRIQTIKGGAQPLPESTRNYFEPRFGYEFRNVRIHTDAQAAETTRALNARAFTLGHDIVFGAGQYAPKTTEGKRLLAHELTHVVQQEGSILIQKKGKGKKKGEDKKPLASAPKEITDDLKQKMAATILAEAFEGQEYDIAWIYYNHVISKGEEGLNVSSAFKGKGDWFKVWMVALADTTYAKDKPKPETPDVSEYDTIEDYVKKHEWFKINGPPHVDKVKELIGTIFKDPSKNPYKGWRGQGSLDDFNRDDGQWILSRQYFYLQEEEKVTDIYVKKLPADKKEYTSFIFHREEIKKYFNRNPEMLKKPVKKYTP